jgi:hypothetical protein
VGDVVLIIADTNGTKQAAIRRVSNVTSDATANRTGVALATISIPSLTELSDSVAQTQSGVYVMRAAASPFGHNAPKQPVYSDGIFQNRYSEWSLEGEYPNLLTLSARNDKIFPDSWVVIGQFDLKDAGAERTTSEPLQLEDLTWTWIISKVINITHLAVARYGMAGSGTLLFLEKGWKRINESLVLLRTMTVAAQSEELAVAALPVTYPVYGSTVALNNRVDTLPVGRPVAFSGKHQHLRITNLAPNAEPVPLPPNLNFPLIGAIVEALQRPRLYFSLTEYVDLQPGDRLRLAAPPLQVVGFKLLPLSPADFGAALKENSLFWLSLVDRDGRVGAALLFSSWFGLDAAAADDETISEIAFIDDDPIRAITQDRDRTTLQLASPLTNVYDRANVRINANVAAASHGESVKEVLGSGAATLAYQSFTLRQSPLTYVSADTPSGSQSTLKVFVNDVLWQEAPFFYGRGAAEHIYVIRRDDEGRTTIQFGDGVNGARLPTGQNNVRAEYRKGSGSGGLVTAEQISQLLSRPLGLKEVINREAAQGAQDAESRDDARKNAPLTVLTLERAVSLQDYEDFSRTFAGIAKAQAVWLWDGRKRTLFITVAGPDGADLDEDGMVVTQLKEALRAYGDPYAFFTVKNFRKVLFQIQGTVTVDADHVLDSVMAAVKEALRERYSFNAREFGQPVALSEVIAAIQAVPGVVAVDLDMFFRNDAPAPPLQARLVAQSPAMGGDGVVLGAELLLLDEAALNQLDGAQ